MCWIATFPWEIWSMAVDCIELDVYHYLILVLLRKLLIRVSLQGRMVEIFGKEASGKTTLALHVVKEAQKNGGLSFIYDALFFLPLLRLVRILLKKNPNRKTFYFILLKSFSIFDFFHIRGLYGWWSLSIHLYCIPLAIFYYFTLQALLKIVSKCAPVLTIYYFRQMNLLKFSFFLRARYLLLPSRITKYYHTWLVLWLHICRLLRLYWCRKCF